MRYACTACSALVRIRAGHGKLILSEHEKSFLNFLGPRFWSTWLGLGLMRLLVLLPFGMQLAAGRMLGRAASRVLRQRSQIALTNLELCFPEMSRRARMQLLRLHFESLGQGVFETAFTWWAPDRRLAGLADTDGLAYLDEALRGGKGVILLSAHFTTLEIGCRLLLLQRPFHPMYRRHENPLFEKVMRASRERLSDNPIRKDDVRQLLRSLRSGHAVWYAPDQAYRGKNAAPVPFFGVPAATNLATSRLARMSGAPVLPFFSLRLPDGRYRLSIQPPLAQFPGEDPRADAERINVIIEEMVREAPEQYLWVHRRFKATETGSSDPYEDGDAA